MELYQASQKIIEAAIRSAMPDDAVERALAGRDFAGKVHLVAIGKAAWQMAKAASDSLGNILSDGVVITKYGHVKGELPRLTLYEAGHPVPDSNSYKATRAAMDLVSGLSKEDTVLFLISGGGSALFESPLIPEDEMADITRQLLACGADICEMNAIRKRLSAVKGGRFGELCSPAKVLSIILSDIIGDPLDMIASGPAYPDSSTSEEAVAIAQKYGLKLSAEASALLQKETPKRLDNVTSFVTGSVKQLCVTAAKVCSEIGFEPVILTSCLNCEAREAGAFLGTIAKEHAANKKRVAFLAGGETVVHLTGNGTGGRNQEIALAAAREIAGLKGVSVFSFGSDGTDGPTDAAGGYADGSTFKKLKEAGFDISETLRSNDAYHALKAVNGLIVTGPTGTNVNDLAVVLVDPSAD